MSSAREIRQWFRQCFVFLCGAKSVKKKGAGHGRLGEGVVQSRLPEAVCGPFVDRIEFGSRLLPDNGSLARLALGMHPQLDPPKHSGRSTVALVVYHAATGSFRAEVATATEVVGLAGGVDAGCCAIARLLTRRAGHTPLDCVDRVVVAVSALKELLPGYQCRQMLAEQLADEVQVICAWQEGARPRAKAITVAELWPHPCAYRHLGRDEVAVFAGSLASLCEAPFTGESDSARRNLYEGTKEAAMTEYCDDEVHPVRYAAGVLFETGVSEVCAAVPAADHTVSIEAVARLSFALEARRRSGNRALLLLVSDQWGVLHAPFAVGRSYLVERGFGDLLTAVHNPLTGAVQELRCSDLTGVVPVANSDAPAANATPMEGCTVTAPCASDSVSRSSLQGGDESQAGDVAVGKDPAAQDSLAADMRDK